MFVTHSSQPPGKGMPPGKVTIIAAIIGAVAAILSGLIGVFAGRVTASGGDPQPRPTLTVTATAAAPVTTPANLRFALTRGSLVHWCQSYYGTGTIPSGYTLMLFDISADPTGSPEESASYSFDGKAIKTSADQWQTQKPLEAGKPGQAARIDIVGVLGSDSVYAYINSISTDSGTGWGSTDLPPGTKISLPIVTDGEPSTKCSS